MTADIAKTSDAGQPADTMRTEPPGWRDAYRDHLMATRSMPKPTASKLAAQVTYKPNLFRATDGPTAAKSDAAGQIPQQLHLASHEDAASASETVITPGARARKPKPMKSVVSEEPTPRELRIIDAGAAIALDQPTEADKAFLARQLVQATLPHTDPGDVLVWSRRNGNLTLAVQQGITPDQKLIGHPYGNIPRLLLYWLTTEALRKGEKRVELGDSLGAFMRELGLDPKRGGKRSDRVRLEEQMRRLFAARISFVGTATDGSMSGEETRYLDIAEKTVFWWSGSGKANPDRSGLFQSFVVLNQSFFDQITSNPVPVDVRAIRALQRSPLALDLYNLMSYQAFRAYKSGKPVFMTYKQMQGALGTNYADADNLKKAVKGTLAKVLAVHPGLRLSGRFGGIEVLASSRLAIPER